MFRKSVEQWTIKNDGREPRVKTPEIMVVKIAVRDSRGRFHGATNFKDR